MKWSPSSVDTFILMDIDGRSRLLDLQHALQSVLGDVGSWDRLSTRLTTETVSPDTSVRAVGDTVTDALVVECGLFEVVTPGEPPRWAVAGSMIGIAAALSRDSSKVDVIARRHSRLVRIPAEVLWDRGGDARGSMIEGARLARLPDHGLQALPPDPLIVTALLEGCDEALEDTITRHLQEAVRVLHGARLVPGTATPPTDASDLAQELATHESGTTTIVYVVRGADGDRAANLVIHADRVIVFQPYGVDAARSAALRMAYDGSPRRYTELVYVHGAQRSTSTATRQMQLPPKVKRIHLLPDPSSTQLESLLTDLRGGAREHDALREFEVFVELSGPELAWIQSTLQWTRVDGGSLLVRQGDPAEGAWLVRAGRLQETRTTTTGERQLSVHGPGDIIGVNALLRGLPHTTSVRAVRDSTIARLEKQTFETLLERSAGFGRAVARMLAAGSTGSIAADLRRARTISVVPLAEQERVSAFVAEWSVVCDEVGLKATIVDAARLNDALGPNASGTRRGDVGDGEIIRWLDRLERHHDVVILVCRATVDSWTRRAIRQSDHILVVADATTSPELRPIERELADATAVDSPTQRTAPGGNALRYVGARHLVLLQPNGLSEATGTGGWLVDRPRHTHHHVRDRESADLARLARRLSGRAVALALSGGSSRAPAHFGVVRAMEDFGIPIDIASGTSSGAGVAALIAAGLRGEEGLAHALKIIAGCSPRLRQFQPPITALTSGAAADRSLQAVFGERQLEDQFMPVVITAVDIRRHRPVFLTRGPIWKLVRASGSLPLLWPPVWHENDLLVDGGILNNLPTEVFDHAADNGLVVASNLDATAGLGAPAFGKALDYGTVLNGWEVLARRLLRRKAPAPPGLIAILFHSMAISNYQQMDGLAAFAERENVCVLTPPIGTFGLFEVDAKIGRELEAVSWEYARHELRSVAARWHARLEWRVTTSAAGAG